MSEKLAVYDLETAVCDALVRGDNVLWLKGDDVLYGRGRHDISVIQVDSKYISNEVAFVKFPRNDIRKGVLVKEASSISFEEYYNAIEDVSKLANNLMTNSKELEAFPRKEETSIEILYMLPRGKKVDGYINKPFTGIFNKIFITYWSKEDAPWFALTFKKKNAKKFYFMDYHFLVADFLKLPLNKTYSLYLDGLMAFSEGGFQKKSDRKLIYLYSIYQLD
jgi:hypothetical protein